MQAIVQSLMTLLLPQENACHLCGGWAERGILCEKCWQGMRRQQIAHPARHFRKGAVTVVSRWKHHSEPRRLVHHFKYRTDPRAALLLAEGMTAALAEEGEVLRHAQLILPVPLHPLREKERGYNQAELLAREISALVNLPMRTNLLYRTRQTGALAKMTRSERLAVMRSAFAVGNAEEIRGKKILLVDDVFTTGATTQACAEALYQAGAARVYAVTACRA